MGKVGIWSQSYQIYFINSPKRTLNELLTDDEISPRIICNNLFTTSDPPKIRIPILQIFVFVIEGGQENIFLLVENIFWTNEKMFSCPPSITKTNIWRIGIRIFWRFQCREQVIPHLVLRQMTNVKLILKSNTKEIIRLQ